MLFLFLCYFMKKPTKILTVILSILLLFALALSACSPTQAKLVIKDYQTNQTYLTIPLGEDKEFSIDFIHSVNKSNVKEKYKIENNEIVCHTLVYSAFGAGMPDDLSPDLSLSYDSEGNMVISGYNIRFSSLSPLILAISIPYDHILTVNGEEYSLGTLIGHGETVIISFEN